MRTGVMWKAFGEVIIDEGVIKKGFAEVKKDNGVKARITNSRRREPFGRHA